MSGFDPAELLPYYLDETDEQVGILNDALLRLEQDPADVRALQEAFRIVHSIKGASIILGFSSVNALTHHLESYFDQLRGGKRSLDRSALDVCFRCLDALRDYHKDLRARGQSAVDLSGRIAEVLACLEGSPPAARDAPAPPPADEPATPGPAPPGPPAPPGGVGLTVVFEPNLQWRDMKARLILNRLSAKARILATDPPADHLEQVEARPTFTVWVAAEGDLEGLRALADVDGVAEVRVEREPSEEGPAGPVATPPPPPEPGPVIRPESAPGPPEPAPTPRPTAPAPAPVAVQGRVAETLRVDVDRLDHLMNLAGELVISKARFAEVVGGLRELFRGADARGLAEEFQERLDRLSRDLDRAAAPGVGHEGDLGRCAAQARRLREDFRSLRGHLDRLLQGREQFHAMAEAVNQLARTTDGLQKGVLDTRMVPIGPLFERFRRVVRDLSLASGKEVALKLGGEATELDKRMIDELADPLIHMVRNAVDHGLEPPERRQAAGKPRAGTVSLLAARRGNSVAITVSDDGRGIDCGRLRQKVVAHGLIGEDEARQLDDRQLIPFIWHPGLSTAERVTDLSGRGVGMDIVKARIEGLNGSVDIRTEPGRGTTFIIRLPLTLAILPSLLARIYDEVYAIPLDDVQEIVEVHPRSIRRVHGQATIDLRGRYLALIELNDVFRWGGGDHPALRRDGGAGRGNGSAKAQVVIAQNGETSLGLRVDELLGMQEVVLKSLEKNFRPIRGLSGASIRGDGRVSLVLDIDALIGLLGTAPSRAG